MTKVLPVLVFLVLTVAGFFFLPLLKIKHIDLNQDQKCITKKELSTRLTIIGRNIFLISEDKLTNDIKNKFNCPTEVKIEKKFPSTLKIEVIDSQPVVKIAQTIFSATESGEITKNEDPNNPTLYLPIEKLEIGQKITDEITLMAIKIASQLSKSDLAVANIRLASDQNIAVYNYDGVVTIFSSKKDISRQLDSLQQVLSMAKIDATKIAKIDLRFDKPIVEFKK